MISRAEATTYRWCDGDFQDYCDEAFRGSINPYRCWVIEGYRDGVRETVEVASPHEDEALRRASYRGLTRCRIIDADPIFDIMEWYHDRQK